MKAFVLLLLLNHPNGTQEIASQSREMSAAECAPLAQAVWDIPAARNPVVAMSPEGPLQRYDAACVPADQL